LQIANFKIKQKSTMNNKLSIVKAEEGELFQAENDNSSNRE
jgi:hypothetical protein